MRRIFIFLLFASVFAAQKANAAELHPRTQAGFDHYIQVVNARIQSELNAASSGRPFLDFELKDAGQQRSIRDQLQRGETYIEKVEDKENGRNVIDVPDGIIHHWRATVFIPGADLKSTLALIRDYDNNKNVYK